MIIKYRAYNMHGLCWEMISEITSFRYSKITEKQREYPDLSLNDYIQWRDKDGKVEQDVEDYKYFQAWHKRSSEPVNIITNMPVFVLNDEGKTIEKIN